MTTDTAAPQSRRHALADALMNQSYAVRNGRTIDHIVLEEAALELRIANLDRSELIALHDAARSEAQPSGYDGLRQALAEAIEFAEQDWQALTPEGDAMLDRWRAALTFTASLSDASPSSGDE